jgi:uncharacterized protein (TIGR00369 family)
MTLDVILQALRSQPGLIDTLGLAFDTSEDGTRVSLTLTPDHQGAPGIAHGGTVMALLDTALGFHALKLALEDGRATSTVEMKTNFLRPARVGQTLVVRSEVQARGKSLLVLSGVAEDAGTGERVAFAVGTFNLFGVERLEARA